MYIISLKNFCATISHQDITLYHNDVFTIHMRYISKSFQLVLLNV